ncbi:MAG: hypothetical protein AB1782_02300 [Cyanobacteriota bacterium]
MEYDDLGYIIGEIDKSLDKQINLISLQLCELKNQICSIEDLLLKIKLKEQKNK